MSHRKARRIPAYTHHKPTGQARVRIDGRDYYLGAYGSQDSHERYDELISELVTGHVESGGKLTVTQLLAAFWRHAKSRYRNTGKGKFGAAVNWRPIIRMLREHYGPLPARDLGPLKVRAIVDDMVGRRWSRRYISDNISRVKQVFKWAAAQELIGYDVYARLATLSAPRFGETNARETEPVRPVAEENVNATLPHLQKHVADMVRFQRLTGARPAEVCIVRPMDIDRSSDIWTFVPHRHKTQHCGKQRTIYIGPKAQDVLRPYLLRVGDVYCFRTRRSPRYTTDSYRRAIHRACDRAFPPPGSLARRDDESPRDWIERLTPEQLQKVQQWQSDHRWSPNQLRHAAGTAVRALLGVETAQAILGHSNLQVTQIYAEVNQQRAIEAAKRLG